MELAAERTALVVVDLVPFFVDANPYCRGILEPVGCAASTVRGAGGTVAWVVPGDERPNPVRTEFYGADTAVMFAAAGGAGTPIERVWRAFDISADDLVVSKTGPSAFFPGRCDLHTLLEARGIDTLLVAGTVTNVCVESTVRDASGLGYRVILLADATAAMRDQDHNATLHTVYRSFGDVRSTADALALVTD